MRTELVEAKAHHCGQIARRLRKDHAAVLAAMGVAAHADLRQRFDASPHFRKAWLVDGKLMAVGGVDGTMASSDGFVWLALAEDAPKLAAARMILAEFEKLIHVKHRLSTFILRDDAASLRVAHFLGFLTEGSEMRRGVNVLTMVHKTRKAA